MNWFFFKSSSTESRIRRSAVFPPGIVMVLLLPGLFLLGCEGDLPTQGHEMENLTILPFDTEISHIVADADPSRPYVYAADIDENRIHVIDTRSKTVARSVIVGTKPFTLVIDPASNRLYVGLIGSWAIEVIDLTTFSSIPAERVQLNFAPYYFAVDRSGQRLYASTIYDTEDHSYFEGTRIVDLATGASLDSVFARGPLAFDRGTSHLYVNSIADVLMYDVSSDNLSEIKEVEIEEVGDPVDLVPDSGWGSLYLLNGRASLGSAIVEIFECGSLKKIAELDTESVPMALALTNDDAEVFVVPSEPISKTGGNFVIRYDAATNQKLKYYKALGKPGRRGLVVTPDGSMLYLVVENPYYISDDPFGNVRHDIQVIDL